MKKTYCDACGIQVDEDYLTKVYVGEPDRYQTVDSEVCDKCADKIRKIVTKTK